MANLEAGTPVFVRQSGRLGHVVAFVGTDGAGENILSVRIDDDGSVFNAGESSLGDPSEAQEPVTSEPEQEPAAATPVEPASEAAPVADESEAAPETPEATASDSSEAPESEVSSNADATTATQAGE